MKGCEFYTKKVYVAVYNENGYLVKTAYVTKAEVAELLLHYDVSQFENHADLVYHLTNKGYI